MNMTMHYRLVYAASAEVVGMALHFLDTTATGDQAWINTYMDNITKMLQGIQGSKPDQFLVCVHGMQKHFPRLVDRLVQKHFPRLVDRSVQKYFPHIGDRLVQKHFPHIGDRLVQKHFPHIVDRSVQKHFPHIVDRLVQKHFPRIVDRLMQKYILRIVDRSGQKPYHCIKCRPVQKHEVSILLIKCLKFPN